MDCCQIVFSAEKSQERIHNCYVAPSSRPAGLIGPGVRQGHSQNNLQ